MTETDILALGCILLALACAGLCVYAWQEHMQAIHHRIRAEEQAMWADHFQAAAIRALYAELGSKNQTVIAVYGAKSSQRWAWITDALAAPEPARIISMRRANV